MDGMAERVAHAIHAARAAGLLGADVARSAIAAMREPTEAMRFAAIEAFKDPRNRHGAVFNEVYGAMIDAALKE